jgi:hypothetical protein
MLMLETILGIIGIATVTAFFQYVARAIVTAQINYIVDPLLKVFWEHAGHYAKRQGHPKVNSLRCPDCDARLRNLPD